MNYTLNVSINVTTYLLYIGSLANILIVYVTINIALFKSKYQEKIPTESFTGRSYSRAPESSSVRVQINKYQMDLLEEYKNQQKWRNWQQYIEHLPLQHDQYVVDLGCSIGNVAHLLSRRVGKVTGIDLNNDFIDYCCADSRENETFLCADITEVDYDSIGRIDGVWSSFSLSYLASPLNFLANLYQHMEAGAWIALLDVSCFISGNMLGSELSYTVNKFEKLSYASRKYDFDFGSKMDTLLKSAGFEVIFQDGNATDLELNFDGPAGSDVYVNWQARLERMKVMHRHFENDYSKICNELLLSISSQKHRKQENIKFTLARKI